MQYLWSEVILDNSDVSSIGQQYGKRKMGGCIYNINVLSIDKLLFQCLTTTQIEFNDSQREDRK